VIFPESRNIYYKIVRSTTCPSWINLLLPNITMFPNQSFGKIKNDDIFGGPQTVSGTKYRDRMYLTEISDVLIDF
jgi:hypothetical protein